jgi:hypothetical protein
MEFDELDGRIELVVVADDSEVSVVGGVSPSNPADPSR